MEHEYLSIREAAKQLEADPKWLAGAIASLGIPLMPIGNSKAVKRSDLAKIKVPPRRKRQPA